MTDHPPRFRSGPYPFNQKGCCHWCGGPVVSPRRTWCSEACVTEWTVRTSGAAVRAAVYERDHGICTECGIDTTAEKRTRYEASGRTWHDHWGIRADWDADHIVAVWRGGGLAGLDGYQTLCRPCHAAKTAREAAERAQLRRPPEADQLALGVLL